VYIEDYIKALNSETVSDKIMDEMNVYFPDRDNYDLDDYMKKLSKKAVKLMKSQ